MKSGVYSITNVVTGQIYIGSSSRSVFKRWVSHKYQLLKGVHENQYLQRAWNRYGQESFEFAVLEHCPPESAIEREQTWIDSSLAHVSKGGYNISPTAQNCAGVKHSEQTKLKLSDARKGKQKTPEHRRKIGESQVGKTITIEQREKLREAAIKQWSDQDARNAQSLRKKGCSAWNKGLPITEEHRAKLVAHSKARMQTAEGRAHIDRLIASCRTPEARKKISEAHKGMKASDEARAKMSAARTGKPNPKAAEKLRGRKRPDHAEKLRGKPRFDQRTPTPEMVSKMCALRESGLSYAKIAQQIGKNVATVFRFIKKTNEA